MPKHCYRAHNPTAGATAFIYAHSLDEAKASPANPNATEWRDEGEVPPSVVDAEGWPV